MIETLERYQLSPQDLAGGSFNPTITSLEISKMQDVEEVMRVPWGSFDQVQAFRRHIRADGRVIIKGFGGSMAYMPAVTKAMREEIMRETLGFQEEEDTNIQRWQDEGEGEIFCMSKDAEERPDLVGLFTKFVEASGRIIDHDHPFRNHPRVEKFLAEQALRMDFVKVVAEDAQEILDTPEFTGWSSMNPKYRGKGKMYLIEIYYDGEEVYGSCPDGSMRPLKELPIDECHKSWIWDGLIAMVKKPMIFPEGYRLGGNGEDTSTVPLCDGRQEEESRGSCSDFFEFMESDIEIVNISVTSSATVADRMIQVIDTFGRVHIFCSGCNKIKEKCNCKEEVSR